MSVGVRPEFSAAAVTVAVGASVLACVSPSAARAIAPERGGEIVKCSSAIEVTPPSSPISGDRVLFDRVWIAGRDGVASPTAQPFGSGPFVYHAKTGFSVKRGRIGALVDIPAAWRNRVRITWGNVAPSVSIRFPGCRFGPTWTSYAGGFLFRDKRGGCVPLQVTVTARTRIVYFSAGRHC